MDDSFNLQRFVSAQMVSYEGALAEIRAGKKRSHWMWFIFPQLAGLGTSQASMMYAINDLREADAYLQHPVLGPRLVEISVALLDHSTNNANQIFGSPDDHKLRSSMTLFALVPDADPVFQRVLDKFYNGLPDPKTLALLY